MIKELINLANHLESMGFEKEAILVANAQYIRLQSCDKYDTLSSSLDHIKEAFDVEIEECDEDE